MSYETNDLFLASLEIGLTKESSAADALARDLLEEGFRGITRRGTSAAADVASLPWYRRIFASAPSAPKGVIDDDLLDLTRGVLGRTEGTGLRGEIEVARQNILNEANKRMASSALAGAGVGGVTGAATADQGEGAQGFLRGAVLGGLGGAALGGLQASRIRKKVADEFATAGTTHRGLGDFMGMRDLRNIQGKIEYNPLKKDVRSRIESARGLREGLSNMADDVAGQAFSPIGAAALGGGLGAAGTVGYKYVNNQMGGGQPKRPQMGPPPPPMPPLRMPPPRMPPPRMPYPMYGYYPYGGR